MCGSRKKKKKKKTFQKVTCWDREVDSPCWLIGYSRRTFVSLQIDERASERSTAPFLTSPLPEITPRSEKLTGAICLGRATINCNAIAESDNKSFLRRNSSWNYGSRPTRENSESRMKKLQRLDLIGKMRGGARVPDAILNFIEFFSITTTNIIEKRILFISMRYFLYWS